MFSITLSAPVLSLTDVEGLSGLKGLQEQVLDRQYVRQLLEPLTPRKERVVRLRCPCLSVVSAKRGQGSCAATGSIGSLDGAGRGQKYLDRKPR